MSRPWARRKTTWNGRCATSHRTCSPRVPLPEVQLPVDEQLMDDLQVRLRAAHGEVDVLQHDRLVFLRRGVAARESAGGAHVDDRVGAGVIEVEEARDVAGLRAVVAG